ncbi:hypothetical protein LEP1GSC163_3865 [Leptospira santarosai str. CBC379]|uniref:hypothetical protein n=1 Tax=Leptospira santarosai TaxID=28183 RepID=UPI000298276A|nr:hypothetical protein [Leptospira santarosai]EKR90850.1 hypothetical protein LEP1GSC163_3865 [Leptospira santarosai str. CBC379]
MQIGARERLCAYRGRSTFLNQNLAEARPNKIFKIQIGRFPIAQIVALAFLSPFKTEHSFCFKGIPYLSGMKKTFLSAGLF